MYLGLDLGTTNVKALVVDDCGHIVSEGTAPVERIHTPEGGVEQNIEQIWDQTCAAIRSAVTGIDATAIQAIGVSSQGAALQWLDGDGQPIGPIISWLDGRGRTFDDKITEELGEDFFADHIGRCRATMAVGQILRLREQSPELFSRPKQIGFVGDVIVGRLCGRRAHDPTSLSIAALLNPSLGRADPQVLAHLGINEDELPELVPVQHAAGRLKVETADCTGLSEGIPVSAAIHDQYAAVLGSGSVSDGDVSLGTGTAWVLVANTGQLSRPITPETFVCPHPVPGLYGQLLSMVNGGSALDWAGKLIGRNNLSGEEIDAVLQTVPPGSDGLCFWPLLSPGGPQGTSESGGRLSGITLRHTSRHLLRAVLEGLGCELTRHLGFFTQAGFSVQRLVMTGSPAASHPRYSLTSAACPWCVSRSRPSAHTERRSSPAR
ncbi:MAG: hypothetical protein GXP27_10390 [Planctomycetes bacterium]|nr:hypothetical protein [Planctomycetota bacterium]